MKRICISIISIVLFQTNLQAQFNVKTFGAKGDGLTMDTHAIQIAIDKAWGNNGGKVEVPAGTYKIGTIILKDNVELHLQNGATLLGSSDYKDYIAINQKYESRTRELYAKYFMIFSEGAKNISITGSGIIHGNGLKHFQEVRPQNLRPYLIRLVNCENVLVRDVQLLESANWTLHLLGCREVNIDGIVIETTAEGNRDGLDIDACNRVKVANSRFSTTDDAIVLKATNDELCENIVISNCIVLRCGGSGIKTGTESNGGFKNIAVSNCTINNISHHAGIELMTVDGGMMENILLENISMDSVATPFFIRLGIRARPYKQGQYVRKIEDVKDIYLNNISVSNARLPSSIIGLHRQKIRNVNITNYTVRYNEIQKRVPFNSVSFQEFDYPAASMFSQLPAFGLYCRSVEDLYLQNIKMYAWENEDRPGVTFERVNYASLFSISGSAETSVTPMFHFRNSSHIVAAFCKSNDKSKVLFETEENTVKELLLTNNILHSLQIEKANVPAMDDNLIFEDFPTEIKHIVKSGSEVAGLSAHDLNVPLKIAMDITKRGSIQLCLLIVNETPIPKKVLINYEGIKQEFLVNWNEWGWAPISLVKGFDKNQPVTFEISTKDSSSGLMISRAYLRYQDTGFTD